MHASSPPGGSLFSERWEALQRTRLPEDVDRSQESGAITLVGAERDRGLDALWDPAQGVCARPVALVEVLHERFGGWGRLAEEGVIPGGRCLPGVHGVARLELSSFPGEADRLGT